MKDKKDLISPSFWIIAVILGVAIFKQFDFEKLQFKNLGLGMLYTLTFLFSVFIIIKGRKTKNSKNPIL